MKKKDKTDENLETIFCSELVAEGFQRMRIIPNCVLNSNEVMPSAFSKGQNVIDRLMLHESICDDERKILGNEKVITWDDIEANYKDESCSKFISFLEQRTLEQEGGV